MGIWLSVFGGEFRLTEIKNHISITVLVVGIQYKEGGLWK